jgi:uncharacterized protein (DUF342 family)
MSEIEIRAKIIVSADSLFVWIEQERFSDSGFGDLESLKAEFTQMGLVGNFNDELLAEVFANQTDFTRFTLLQATLPTHGSDGRIEWLKDVSAKPKFVADDDEAVIDYKNSMQISTTKIGDKIAEIIPPQQGIPGKDIYDRTLMAKDGKPNTIRLGQGVEQKGNFIFATQDGIPKFKAGMLIVDNLLVIDKNLSMETGNIKTPSSLEIKGNVEDGFEIQCGGDLIVYGTIGASTLQVKGNIEVRGGILGRTKAKIRCGGRVEAKFIDATTIEADGGIYVTKDIIHSQISSLDEVQCRGTIIGGKILAMNHVEAREMGNQLGAKTEIHIQKHYRIEKAHQLSQMLFNKAELIKERTAKWVKESFVEENSRSELLTLISELEKLILTQEAVERELQNLHISDLESIEATITCHFKINPDVTFFAINCQKTFLDIYNRKSTWSADVSSGSMKVTT